MNSDNRNRFAINLAAAICLRCVDTLFVLNSGISIKPGNGNENNENTPSAGNDPVQRVKVEESTGHKWVNVKKIPTDGVSSTFAYYVQGLE